MTTNEINFDSFTLSDLRMYGSHIIVNHTNCELSSLLTDLLADENNEVTIIDARTIIDYQDLRKRLEQVSQGYLLFTHVIDGKLDDMVKSHIRYCIKSNFRRDYNDITTIYPDGWENHLAHTKLGIFILIEPGQEKDDWLQGVSNSSSCGILSIDRNGFILK